jgi:hypothetical protein
MECPHCEYVPEDDCENEFYTLPVKVGRLEDRTNEYRGYYTAQKTVYACPECSKLFIEGE